VIAEQCIEPRAVVMVDDVLDERTTNSGYLALD
jgi:hypothetical protein